MKALIALAVTAGLLGAAACGGDESASTVTGTVVVPAQAPSVDELPAASVLTVTLEDISRADAPSTVLAMQQNDLADNTFPIDFELPYDLGDIAETNTYRVAARVTAGGDLLMISDTVVPVITQGAPTSGVELPLVSLADE
jgi:putative lipoprotein